jgi:lysophospholipase L1-like esterase
MTTAVFLGDSNMMEYYVTGSQNMASLVSSRFGFTKYNASVSGNKTAQMTARVATDVLSHSPDVVFAMAGTNDGAYAFENNIAASVWVPQWLSDMEDLIDALSSVSKIIICSPIPARRSKLCAEWPAAVTSLAALCATKGVIYCPMYEGFISTAVAMMGYSSPTKYYLDDPDRFHLNTAGHGLAGAIMGDCYAANVS